MQWSHVIRVRQTSVTLNYCQVLSPCQEGMSPGQPCKCIFMLLVLNLKAYSSYLQLDLCCRSIPFQSQKVEGMPDAIFYTFQEIGHVVGLWLTLSHCHGCHWCLEPTHQQEAARASKCTGQPVKTSEALEREARMEGKRFQILMQMPRIQCLSGRYQSPSWWKKSRITDSLTQTLPLVDGWVKTNEAPALLAMCSFVCSFLPVPPSLCRDDWCRQESNGSDSHVYMEGCQYAIWAIKVLKRHKHLRASRHP